MKMIYALRHEFPIVMGIMLAVVGTVLAVVAIVGPQHPQRSLVAVTTTPSSPRNHYVIHAPGLEPIEVEQVSYNSASCWYRKLNGIEGRAYGTFVIEDIPEGVEAPK